MTTQDILNAALTIPRAEFRLSTLEPKYLTWKDDNGTIHVEVEEVRDYAEVPF